MQVLWGKVRQIVPFALVCLSVFFFFFFFVEIDCLFLSYGESRARYNLTEPIPLQVEHVAVEVIVDTFRSSGPCLRTMKIDISTMMPC